MLVLAAVPGHAATVTATLDEFAAAVKAGSEKYDEEHSVRSLLRPLKVTWLTIALFWISLLGGIVAFAVMIVTGGPSFDFEDARWDIRVPIAALVFAAGVVSQLLRALPRGRTGPPRRDYALISTAFGAGALALMLRLPTAGVPVEPVWVIVTSLALVASLATAVPQIIARRRDRELTRRVDALEEDRLTASGTRLEELADAFAHRLEDEFAALPAADQKTLTAQWAAATNVLRERGIIDTPTGHGARAIRLRATRHLQPLFPGFLLLEKRVQELWDPSYSEPRSRLRVNWFLTEYQPRSRRAAKSARS